MDCKKDDAEAEISLGPAVAAGGKIDEKAIVK